MCLLVLAWRAHPRYQLVVAANRDEFHARPTSPLSVWTDPPGLLAGRDLRAGGTWLGVAEGAQNLPGSPAFAFGAITNFREQGADQHSGPSRGGLIPEFIRGGDAPSDFFAAIEPHAGRYAGFNLLLARGKQLWYASNRTQVFARALTPGIYGLSNHTLDTPWPKLERIRAGFGELLSRHADDLNPARLFTLLDQREVTPADASWEEVLAAPFVVHPTYGTRSSTVVLAGMTGEVSITERRFDSAGQPIGQSVLGTAHA